MKFFIVDYTYVERRFSELLESSDVSLLHFLFLPADLKIKNVIMYILCKSIGYPCLINKSTFFKIFNFYSIRKLF